MSDPRPPWPADAIILVSPTPDEVVYDARFPTELHSCRDCVTAVMPRTDSIRRCEADPGRRGRPVRFLCIRCAVQYDPRSVVARVMREYHPALVECGANVGAIMASAEDGPAIKVHGSAALAMVQVVSAKRRPHCEYDAEIVIDRSEWNKLLPAQQDALIDHDLCHLKRKEYSEKKLAKLRKEDPDAVAWILDNLGRPKLGTIPADVTPGDGFEACIVRHGEWAVEFVTAKRFKDFAGNALKKHKEQGAAS